MSLLGYWLSWDRNARDNASLSKANVDAGQDRKIEDRKICSGAHMIGPNRLQWCSPTVPITNTCLKCEWRPDQALRGSISTASIHNRPVVHLPVLNFPVLLLECGFTLPRIFRARRYKAVSVGGSAKERT